MKFSRRRSRRAIAGIVATVIMFAILFTVGTSYFIFVNSQNASYVSSLLAATNKVQGGLTESLTITTLLDADGDIGFYANDTSALTVNMTAVLVLSSTGTLLKCLGLGFPSGQGCVNTVPPLWVTVNAGKGSPTIDTEYVYTTGTVTVKVLTARGNTYVQTYPEASTNYANNALSSESVVVNLNQFRWHALTAEPTSVRQTGYTTTGCSGSGCAVTTGSSVTVADTLIYALGWYGQSPPSGVPTDTLGSTFTLAQAASSSVVHTATPSMVQSRSGSCNAQTCGLPYTSNVASGDTLVYGLGWANAATPASVPTDTLGDTFHPGESNYVTVNPTAPSVVQQAYKANCSSATCSIATTSPVTAGNTLVFGLGWPSTPQYNYVPVTITNCQLVASAPALDGSNYNIGTTSSLSASLTTTHSSDVIIAIVYGQNTATGSYRTATMSDGAGLTWTGVGSYQEINNSGGNSFFGQIYYAISASTLSSDSIKVTWSSAPTAQGFIQVFGVSGANTSTPFDSHSGLPSFPGNGNYASVSTSNALDFIFGLENTNTTSAPTIGSGWSALTSGVANSYTGSEYQVVSATQSGLSLTYSNSASDANEAWGDAIQGSAGSVCSSGTPAIDGSTGAGTETNSVSASLTTTNANDVIVLFTGTSTSSTTVSSIKDAGGHAWTHRQTKTGSPSVEEEEWYTVASSPLSADSITVTWSATGDNVFTAFGVSGANLVTPFDPNGSLAATATGTTASPSVSVTTSNANDLIVGMLANEHTSAAVCHTEAYGTGFSEFLAESALGANTCMNSDEEYETVTATQSGLAIPFTTSTGGSNQWAEIGDAVEAAPASGTPNPFQQMVTWDPLTYSSWEATNLGNVRFCSDTACAGTLYSWLESCSSACSTAGSTSTSATAWVKLTSSISSGSSLTIYMVFEATSVNFDDNYWGEAPNLSSTYAQYDNGANVFNAYFDGNTATSSFSVASGFTLAKSTGVAYGSGTVSALHLTGYGTNDSPLVYNVALTTTGGVVESNFENVDYTVDSGTSGLMNNAAAASVTNYIGTNTGCQTAYFNQDYMSGGTESYCLNQLGTAAEAWLYGSTTYPGTSATLYSGYVAPQLYSTTGGYSGSEGVNPISGAAHLYLGFGYTTNSGAQAAMYYNWARERAYPPNGSMPAVSLGTTSGGGATLAYVPITITNSQTTATPNTFQQMITWDPATYTSYEATNLGNVRFCSDTACAGTLYSWLESCSSACSTAGSTSTSATAWVKLTSSIAANGGTLRIYMVFDLTSVNFDGVYGGEAPNLSSTYAQYDNGANVFNAYFNGNTAPSSFTAGSGFAVSQSTGVTGPGGATINAIHVSGYNAQSVFFAFNAAIPNGGIITEASFANANTGTSTGIDGLVNNATPGSVTNGIETGDGQGNDFFQQASDVNSAYTFGQNGAGTATTAWEYASMTYPGTGSSSWTAYLAPQLYSTTGGYAGTVNNNPISGATNVYLGAYGSTNGGFTVSVNYNFERARAYPPSNVMPTTSFGSTSQGTGGLPAVTDTFSDSFTLGVSQYVTAGSTTYESAIWYATAGGSTTDTITATFAAAVAGTASVYEIAGYSTTSGIVSCAPTCGSSSGGSTAASVSSFLPNSNSFVVGNVETGSAATDYTPGSGYASVQTTSGGCSPTLASQGCNEFETGLSSSTTAPFTLSASTPWVEVAMSFTPLQTNTYYTAIWYATAGGSGSNADTITSGSFGQTVAATVSIYEISGVTTASGILIETGGNAASQSATSVTSIPINSAGYVVIGTAESTSTTYTAGSGFSLPTGANCSSVAGCGEYQTGVGSATTVPMSISPSSPWVEAAMAFAPVTTTYYSYMWYATAGGTGTDTITATFGSTVTGGVASVYDLNGFTTSGFVGSTGSSPAGSTAVAVSPALTPPGSGPIVIGNVETASATTDYTVGTVGGTYVSVKTGTGGCDATHAAQGCSEYLTSASGSQTAPFTLSASSTWVESAISLSAIVNPQNGQQVGGYPALAVPENVKLEWSETFTNLDPQHRSITVFPTSVLTVGTDEDEFFENTVFFIIQGVNVDGTGLVAYNSSQDFTVLPYDTPVTMYFGSMTPLATATDLLDEIAGFQATFELSGQYSDGTLFGATIPYPTGYVTNANAATSPQAGITGSSVSVTCTSPCGFTPNAKATIGWMNSAGVVTTLKTITMTSAGNIPAGTTFTVPSATAGYYTIIVTDYVNSAFMTFQHVGN